MKTPIAIIALAISLTCSTASDTQREVYISEFGWTFKITTNSKLIDSTFDKTGKIKDEFKEIGAFKAIELFSIRDDSTNWFKALAINDTLNFKNWASYHSKDNKWYFEQIALIPTIKILDTTYSIEIIDGRRFVLEYVKYYSKMSNKILSNYHYYGKFDRYELAINFTFSDETFGNNYLKIIESSQFQKQTAYNIGFAESLVAVNSKLY